ncbi:hypothetical protein D3C81_1403700 [compost metagenome]
MRCPRAGIGQQFHLSSQHILQRGGTALVGDRVELHARGQRKLLHADMGRAADAGVRIGDLAGVRLGRRDHVLQRLVARVGWHGDAKGLARSARQVGQLRARVQLQHAELGKARDRDRDLADGVAVRRGARQRLGADHAGSAGAVFHHDRLLENAAGHLAQRAHRLVRRAADRPRADKGDGTLGIRGGQRTRARQQHAGNTGSNAGGSADQQVAALQVDGESLGHLRVSPCFDYGRPVRARRRHARHSVAAEHNNPIKNWHCFITFSLGRLRPWSRSIARCAPTSSCAICNCWWRWTNSGTSGVPRNSCR